MNPTKELPMTEQEENDLAALYPQMLAETL